MPYIQIPDECTPGWWVRGGAAAIQVKTMAEFEDIVQNLAANWGWSWRPSGPNRKHFGAQQAKHALNTGGSLCICLDEHPTMTYLTPHAAKARCLLISFDDAVEGIENQKRLLGPAPWVLGAMVAIRCDGNEHLLAIAKALRPWGWRWCLDVASAIGNLPANMFPVAVPLSEDAGLRAMPVRSLLAAEHANLTVIAALDALIEIDRRCSKPDVGPEPAGCQHRNKRRCPPISPLGQSYWYCPDCKEEV